MRSDPSLKAALKSDAARERQTACCIYNDNSGCVQTLEKDCSVREREYTLFDVDVGLNQAVMFITTQIPILCDLCIFKHMRHDTLTLYCCLSC